MEGRMDAIIVYRKILMQLLNEGFNPFEDNTDYLQLIEKHIKKTNWNHQYFPAPNLI